MSKTLTPEQFEAQARAAIHKKKELVESLHAVIAVLETKLLKLATSPDSASLAEALQAEHELAIRKSFAERLKQHFRPDAELQSILNTTAGREVLKAFYAEKVKEVGSLKSEIAPLRRRALEAELKNDASFHDLNEECENLGLSVEQNEAFLSHAETALRRGAPYGEIVTYLHQIAA